MDAESDLTGLAEAMLCWFCGIPPALPVGGANNPANIAALAAVVGLNPALPGLQPTGVAATDTPNIQGLVNLVGRAQLGLGTFSVNAPLVPPTGKQLWVHGYKGGTQSGAGAGLGIGTVIKAASGWAGTGLPITGIFSVIYGNGTANTAVNEAHIDN
jgi:hypothetical protein